MKSKSAGQVGARVLPAAQLPWHITTRASTPPRVVVAPSFTLH